MPVYNYNPQAPAMIDSPRGRYSPVTPGGIYGNATGNYSWRMAGSDLLRAGAPAPVAAASSLTGNWLRTGTDRLFRATNDREARDYRNHMQDMLNDDARAYNPGVMGGIAEWARNLFGGGDDAEGEGQQRSPAPQPTDNRTFGQQQTIAPRAAPLRGVGVQGGEVVARRIAGDEANNRSLESMAENMLGQSATQRMDQSAQQSRAAFERMFGKVMK